MVVIITASGIKLTVAGHVNLGLLYIHINIDLLTSLTTTVVTPMENLRSGVTRRIPKNAGSYVVFLCVVSIFPSVTISNQVQKREYIVNTI